MHIHNGDHLQFEIDHANTPRELRPDWPLPSFDCKDWAAEFHKRHPSVSADDALPWFAAALMRGFDEGRDNAVKALKGEQL